MTHRVAGQAELVAAYVAERAGVDLAGRRQPELVARVADAMTQAGAASAEQFRRVLDHDAERFEELVVTLTVGESYFFREPAQMELLRRQVLPERAAARGPEGTIRLWSAGCAAGQEAYTLAILLAEEGLAVRSRVLATDLSARALEQARHGLYGKWSLRAVDERRRHAHFLPVPGGFKVNPVHARRVSFRRHNLVDETDALPAGDLDVILCRNVLVYLTPAAVQLASRRLLEALAPGGWLLIASTDPRIEGVDGLQAVATPNGTAYRRPPPSTARAEAQRHDRRRAPSSAGSGRPAKRASAPASSPGPAPDRDRPRPAASRSGTRHSGEAERSTAEPADDPLAPAMEALDRGDYALAATRAAALVGDGPEPAAYVVLVRALGSAGRLDPAIGAAAEATAGFPLHLELRLLHAIVLLESDRPDEAAAAARAALYLDPGLAMAHVTLARAEQARGDHAAADRSYRNALALLEPLPPGEPVALADGETAGRLAGLARAGAQRSAQQLSTSGRRR